MFGAGSPVAGQRNISVLPAGDAMIGDSFFPTQRGPSSQQTRRIVWVSSNISARVHEFNSSRCLSES